MADFNFVETDSAKLYTAIIGSLMDECREALYPGDERRIFGEALVAVFVALYNEFNDKMRQRTLQYARGEVLDALGARYGVERAAPASASATFRFTASAAQAENIIIPAGTRITTDGSVYFATQETAVLPVGAQTVDVLGVCTAGGSAYNGFAIGTIKTLVDLIPYISGASNTTTSTGGDDGEPYTEEGDDRLRERIRLAPSTLSTAGPESGYRYHTMTADPDIVDVAIDCPEDEPNTVNIYPLMRGGEIPDGDTLEKVQAAMADDVRPMTDKVQVMAPQQVEYTINTMAKFQNNAITDNGRALLSHVQMGAVFTPTKIVLGSGYIPPGKTARTMTEVASPVKELPITKKQRTNDAKAIFGGVYSNQDITQDWYFRELALYAKAVYPEGQEIAEVLYSYGNAGDQADLMPSYASGQPVERQMDLVVYVGNDTKIDLTIQSGVYMTRPETIELIEEYLADIDLSITDITTQKKYKWGIDNGIAYLEEVE